MFFEWDEKKDRTNVRKHGFTFTDALRVFGDINAHTYPDRVEDGEQRWHTIGDFEGTVLLVVHTIEEDVEEEKIRIISARKANRRERALYYPSH